MRLRLVPLLLASLLAAAPAAAQQGRTYVSQGGGFRVELPTEWSQVPDEALAVVRADEGAVAGGLMYDAGFRAGAGPWPDPPFVTLSYLPLGMKMTRKEFGAQLEGAGVQAEIDASVAEVGGRVNAPRWDAENGIVWVRAEMPSAGDAIEFMWQASALHPDGRSMITLAYYGAPNQDEAAVRAQLLAVLKSLRAP